MCYLYTTVQKFGVDVIIIIIVFLNNVFEISLLSSPRLHLFDLKIH